MIHHYLSTALRHFRRHKLTTGINVACLAIGVACFAAAVGFVTWLSEADRHFAKADRIYVVGEGIASPMQFGPAPQSSWVVGRHLAADLERAEAVARLRPGRALAVATPSYKGFADSAYADPAFLRIFDLPFIAGDASHALDRPRSIVISESLAQRLFGTREAVGRTFRLQNQETVTVTGVIGELRQPTHMRSPLISFEMLGSMDTYEAILRKSSAANIFREQTEDWTSNWGSFVYVLLPADGSWTRSDLEQQIATFGERRAPSNGMQLVFRAYALPDIQLSILGSLVQAESTGLSATTILLLLGSLVLAAACLNCANLATAQAYARAREVALRRIVGATRAQVIAQHLIESFMLALVAVVFMLVIVLLGVWLVSGASLSDVLVAGLASPRLWIPVAAVLVGGPLLAGGYPAFVLSRMRSSSALRSGRVSGGEGKVPALFVGVQFAVASVMLIMLFVVQAQNAVLRENALGTGGDPIVVVRNDLRDAGIGIDLLRSALLLDPNVRSVTANQMPPWQFSINTTFVQRSADRDSAAVRVYDQRIAYDFFETVGIRLLAGRTFDRSYANDVVDEGDSTRPANVIVDQVLAAQLGWNDPAQAVGQAVFAPTSADGSTPPRRLEIVGVVETQPLVHFSMGMNSGVYYLDPTRAAYPIVRLSGADVTAGLAALDATWAKLVPDVALQRQFIDESFEQSYQIWKIVSTVFAALASLAFGVCVMGLVAMAIHMTGRRIGEIGVRKTLGASAVRILAMLLKDFARPVVIANLLMWPIGFVAASGYFSLFMQRASLNAWPFIGSLVLALTVAWLAVIVQAGRAARMKPAEVLRYE